MKRTQLVGTVPGVAFGGDWDPGDRITGLVVVIATSLAGGEGDGAETEDQRKAANG